MENHRRRARALMVRTFLALSLVAIGVGVLVVFLLRSQVQETYYRLQLDSNRQQAIRLANILEGRLAKGIPAETILKEFQMSLETLPEDDSGYYCLFGNGGKLLCHPNPRLLGADEGDMKLVNERSSFSFNSIVADGKGNGGRYTPPGKNGPVQIIFSQPVKGTSWQVNVHSDMEVLRARCSRLSLAIIGAIAPSLLALVGLGTFAVRMAAKKYETQLLTANRKLEAAVHVADETNHALSLAKTEVEQKKAVVERRNEELDEIRQLLEKRNIELDSKVAELEAAQLRADRIFSALARALPGTVLDAKYRLDRVIGNGGFGAVFKATQVNLGRPVAVKVFRPTPGNDSASSVERFRREAITTSRVSHPNAITVLDSNVSSDGIPYLVMELLKGKTLKEELIEKGRFDLKTCAKILSEACGAIGAAHAAGVIHRDIKPENIFLHQIPEGMTVKVLDFGIASLVQGDDSGNLTEPGLLIGTPSYMAPERLQGKACDEKADVYALGVVLYEMMCGRKPFAGPYQDLLSLAETLKNAPPSIQEHLPRIVPEVEAVVMRALSRDPESRPAAREFSDQFSLALTKQIEAPEGENPPPPTRVRGDSDAPTLLDAFESEKKS